MALIVFYLMLSDARDIRKFKLLIVYDVYHSRTFYCPSMDQFDAPRRLLLPC